MLPLPVRPLISMIGAAAVISLLTLCAPLAHDAPPTPSALNQSVARQGSVQLPVAIRPPLPEGNIGTSANGFANPGREDAFKAKIVAAHLDKYINILNLKLIFVDSLVEDRARQNAWTFICEDKNDPRSDTERFDPVLNAQPFDSSALGGERRLMHQYLTFLRLYSDSDEVMELRGGGGNPCGSKKNITLLGKQAHKAVVYYTPTCNRDNCPVPRIVLIAKLGGILRRMFGFGLPEVVFISDYSTAAGVFDGTFYFARAMEGRSSAQAVKVLWPSSPIRQLSGIEGYASIPAGTADLRNETVKEALKQATSPAAEIQNIIFEDSIVQFSLRKSKNIVIKNPQYWENVFVTLSIANNQLIAILEGYYEPSVSAQPPSSDGFHHITEHDFPEQTKDCLRIILDRVAATLQKL